MFLSVFIFAGLILPILSDASPEPSPIDFTFPERKQVTGLGDYIAQFYTFSLAIAGFLALGAIIVGAIQYIVSAGNAAQQSDARDRIFQALLGLGLLFGAYLILYTISPGLVELREPHIDPAKLPSAWPAQACPPNMVYILGKCYEREHEIEDYKWLESVRVEGPGGQFAHLCPRGYTDVGIAWCDEFINTPRPGINYSCCVPDRR